MPKCHDDTLVRTASATSECGHSITKFFLMAAFMGANLAITLFLIEYLAGLSLDGIGMSYCMVGDLGYLVRRREVVGGAVLVDR